MEKKEHDGKYYERYDNNSEGRQFGWLGYGYNKECLENLYERSYIRETFYDQKTPPKKIFLIKNDCALKHQTEREAETITLIEHTIDITGISELYNWDPTKKGGIFINQQGNIPDSLIKQVDSKVKQIIDRKKEFLIQIAEANKQSSVGGSPIEYTREFMIKVKKQNTVLKNETFECYYTYRIDETKYNLTAFIENNDILLISDFEGTAPTTHFDKFAEYCTKKKVIFLGDVFDNSAQQDDDCNKDVCPSPDAAYEDKCIQPENYCALKTIKLLVDNPANCRYVVGNRDINKIKLIPFFSFKDLNDKWWRNGDTYRKIVDNLLQKLGKRDNSIEFWFIEPDKLNYFRPFWSKPNKLTEYNQRWKNQNNKIGKVWTPIDDIRANLNDIVERFKWIFGKDPDVGTMSALLTLKCIPDEICKQTKYKTFEKFYSKCTIPANLKKEDEQANKILVRVALTITIFMRMLDKPLFNPKRSVDTAPIRAQLWNLETLDGYLYKYLMEAAPAYYAAKGTNLFLFAHGGITQKFVEKNGMEAEKSIKERGWLSGGGGDDTPEQKTLTASNAITTAITNYNTKIYFENLIEFFENDTYDTLAYYDNKTKPQYSGKPQRNPDFNAMLNLLTLSAGSHEATKHYPNQVKQPTYAAFDTFVDDPDNIKIYNIFGHAGAGVGYTFGKARDEENSLIEDTQTYFISTDYSTTLFKDGIACKNSDKYNENYLIMTLNTEDPDGLNLACGGKIFLADKYSLYKPTEGEVKLRNVDDPEKNIFETLDERIKVKINTKDKTTTLTIIPINKNLDDEEYKQFINTTMDNIQKNGINFRDQVNLLEEIYTIDEKNQSKYFLFNGFATVSATANNVPCDYFKVFSGTGKDTPQDIVLIQTTNEIVCSGTKYSRGAADEPVAPVVPTLEGQVDPAQKLEEEESASIDVAQINENSRFLNIFNSQDILKNIPVHQDDNPFFGGRSRRRTRKKKRSISVATRKQSISVATRKRSISVATRKRRKNIKRKKTRKNRKYKRSKHTRSKHTRSKA